MSYLRTRDWVRKNNAEDMASAPFKLGCDEGYLGGHDGWHQNMLLRKLADAEEAKALREAENDEMDEGVGKVNDVNTIQFTLPDYEELLENSWPIFKRRYFRNDTEVNVFRKLCDIGRVLTLSHPGEVQDADSSHVYFFWETFKREARSLEFEIAFEVSEGIRTLLRYLHELGYQICSRAFYTEEITKFALQIFERNRQRWRPNEPTTVLALIIIAFYSAGYVFKEPRICRQIEKNLGQLIWPNLRHTCLLYVLSASVVPELRRPDKEGHFEWAYIFNTGSKLYEGIMKKREGGQLRDLTGAMQQVVNSPPAWIEGYLRDTETEPVPQYTHEEASEYGRQITQMYTGIKEDTTTALPWSTSGMFRPRERGDSLGQNATFEAERRSAAAATEKARAARRASEERHGAVGDVRRAP